MLKKLNVIILSVFMIFGVNCLLQTPDLIVAGFGIRSGCLRVDKYSELIIYANDCINSYNT